jgi:DNA helicase HerA-like ATPase
MDAKVVADARAAFPAGGAAITLGSVVHGGECAAEPLVRLPLAMANRHGLIAGATGTGKTKTLQLMAEQFSAAGVPVFLADLKGDLSGLGTAGEASDRVRERAQQTGWAWQGAARPVEYLSLTGTKGAQVRASVSSFGPLLLARVLGLNETQASVLAMVFKFSDDQKLPLVDFADLRAVLQYLTSEEGGPSLAPYGGMSKATVGVLLREMVELEQQGAGAFLGEPEFDLDDLLQVERDGSGLISVLELQDVQDKPAMFSTFMMWMLARLYHELPEVGDVEKPKLVFFFDEAHLLFANASKAFLDQVQQVVRLVRSKGVGVYFVTQSPRDIPADVLGQLGHRVQHALRAFTPDDEQALKAAARTFPRTPHYEVERTLTSLGIGEALVTVLTPQGTPTMPFATRMIPPGSRMGPLTDAELNERIARSDQVKHYATAVDPDSARERLLARMAPNPPAPAPMTGTTDTPSPELVVGGALAAIGAAMNSPLGRMIAGRVTTQVARGIMGALLGAPTRRRRLF